MAPIYILGLLLRYGPQHGYQLKKTISENLADFTLIKLPTIYYHLERMEQRGWLCAENAKPGNWPEKTVYAITPAGKAAFSDLLAAQLKEQYRPAFASDAAFYFAEHLAGEKLIAALERQREPIKKALATIERHRRETLLACPKEAQTVVKIIFSHHELHYQAELDWVEQSIAALKGA